MPVGRAQRAFAGCACKAGHRGGVQGISVGRVWKAYAGCAHRQGTDRVYMVCP